mmetsp:Transcript_18192/g.35580  ORF Transcript_18192/g.35580 Transcript_18192/m.35580 type:complete len:220 (-) Transcript_18192:102-761(-)
MVFSQCSVLAPGDFLKSAFARKLKQLTKNLSKVIQWASSCSSCPGCGFSNDLLFFACAGVTYRTLTCSYSGLTKFFEVNFCCNSVSFETPSTMMKGESNLIFLALVFLLNSLSEYRGTPFSFFAAKTFLRGLTLNEGSVKEDNASFLFLASVAALRSMAEVISSAVCSIFFVPDCSISSTFRPIFCSLANFSNACILATVVAHSSFVAATLTFRARFIG